MLHRPWGNQNIPLVTSWEIYGRDARIVTLFNMVLSGAEIIKTESTPSVAETIYGDLLLLSQENNDPVKLVINSPGGSILAGFTILQGMEHLKAKGLEVWTCALGISRSMASILLSAGTKGCRYAIQHSDIHFHSSQATFGGDRSVRSS